jgi:hypothetical protein
MSLMYLTSKVVLQREHTVAGLFPEHGNSAGEAIG